MLHAAATLLARPGAAVLGALDQWWRGTHMGALILVWVASPSSYRAPWRLALAQHVLRSTMPHLSGFAVLAALISLVVVRIVLAAAQNYGLSQVALELVVRVLLLELIPLAAALFVALRVTLPAAAELAGLSARAGALVPSATAADFWHAEVVPRALGGLFAVWLLVALNGTLALVLAYVLAHGFSPWALEGYTRLVGRIFNPTVSLVFILKTGAFSAAVSLIPLAAAMLAPVQPYSTLVPQLQGLVRLFLALLVVELLSLVGNYV